jgi:DNA-binding transcriptional LysR family regulator
MLSAVLVTNSNHASALTGLWQLACLLLLHGYHKLHGCMVASSLHLQRSLFNAGPSAVRWRGIESSNYCCCCCARRPGGRHLGCSMSRLLPLRAVHCHDCPNMSRRQARAQSRRKQHHQASRSVAVVQSAVAHKLGVSVAPRPSKTFYAGSQRAHCQQESCQQDLNRSQPWRRKRSRMLF